MTKRASSWLQFKTQFAKNSSLKWRSPIKSFCEIFIPVMLLCALAGIKTTTTIAESPAKIYSQDSWNIPSMEQLLNFPEDLFTDPSFILQNVTKYSWYLQYGGKFLSHGGSNIAWLCYIGGGTSFQFSSTSCQSLMFAVVPESSSNQTQVDAANEFQAYWVKRYPAIEDRLLYFEDSNALDDYMQGSSYGDVANPPLGLGIVFNAAAPSWRYSIRVNRTANYGDNGPIRNIPSTSSNAKTVDNLQVGLSDYTEQYIMSGFLTVQQDVDSFILSKGMNKNISVAANTFPMPIQAYTNDPFWADTSATFGLFMMLSMLYPVAMVIQQLVTEKETKIRELMFMMGLRPSMYHAAWMVFYTLMYTVLSALLTGFASINLFNYSQSSVVFVYFLLFTLSSLSFSFFIASLFERTNVSVVVGLLVYFIGYFLFAALSGSDAALGPQLLVSLLPSAAFCFGTITISEWEGGLIGVKWSNIAESSSQDYTMAICFGMLILDMILYAVLGVYFDAVLPSALGASRHKWWHPFCFFCRRRSKKNITDDYQLHVEEAEAREATMDTNGYFQPIAGGLKSVRRDGNCVLLSNLRKTFQSDKGPVNAVNGVDCTFYEGQCTALLGPNGAGKSTVISMLCGLVPSTSGAAFVGGLSCEVDMETIRLNLGVCPQNNVMYPELTVKEHLQLFAGIKGLQNSKVAITEMIAEVGLTPKTNVKSKSLSGGMKRKLQLAIALFGENKFITLDEPTSGVDPYSRRLMWDAIEKHREGRTIILTTHFMDEADLLGDRIAIMSSGQMTCIGTSLFLKNKFGVGYQMTIEHEGGHASKQIIKEVKSFVIEAVVITDIGTELTIQLPLSASSSFEAMLLRLDDLKKSLDIVQVSISVTTLELVFLRVADGVEAAHEIEDRKLPVDDPSVVGVAVNEVVKSSELAIDDEVSNELPARVNLVIPTFNDHMKGLLSKRWKYAKRDRRAWCCQFVTPLVFLLLGFITFKITPSSNSLALWFEADADFWNTQPENPNPIPFNNLTYSGVSSATIMNLAQMPRIVLQNFRNIPNVEALYCQTEEWYTSNIDSLARILSALPGGELILSAVKAAIPGQTAPMCLSSSQYNSSSTLFSEDLANSRFDSTGSRYGSLFFGQLPVSNATQYTIVYNSSGIHAGPQMMNMADSAMLRSVGETISVASYAFPQTQSEAAISAGFIAFTATLAIAIAFSFVPSSFAVFVVREKEQKSWHQQLINGVNPAAYWLSNAVFDILTFLVPFFFTLILIAAFDVTVLRNSLGLVVLIFLLYGVAITSFTYCCTYFFSNFRYSQFAMIGINLFAGMILLVVAFTMTLVESTYKVNNILMYFYRILPTFSFAHGLLQIANLEINQFLLNSEVRGGDPSNPIVYKPADFEIAGTDILYLAVECVLYSLLLVFLQNRYRGGNVELHCSCSRKKTKGSFTIDKKEPQELQADADVIQEADRVDSVYQHMKDEKDEELGQSRDTVLLHNLRKVYPAQNKQHEKVALNNISLSIHQHECFGLLGINGAGKTTTLSILSGDIHPTDGEAFIDGNNVVTELSRAQKCFGYCPQFDAIFELMTGREHLEFYGRMKGVPEKELFDIVEQKIKDLGLTIHADKLAGGYSGGNKRKLSVAMATIGDPKVVFMDEPSTGMDPVSRRFMWSVISKVSKQSSVILTTHSMEECEALCSRIGIMVDGGLRCLGSSQHLKNVYGQGYQLEINVTLPTNEELNVISNTFGCNLDATLGVDGVIKALEGKPGLYETEFSATGSASLMFQQLHIGRGIVSATTLAEWYHVEVSQLELEKVLAESFPGYILLEKQGVRLRYSLPSIEGLPLSHMFGIIETARESCKIQGYSLGQTTLESVFNSFASTQAKEDSK